MKIVATTSLPAVDRPNADRWNAARSRQFHVLSSWGLYMMEPSLHHEGSSWWSLHAIMRAPHDWATMLSWGLHMMEPSWWYGKFLVMPSWGSIIWSPHDVMRAPHDGPPCHHEGSTWWSPHAVIRAPALMHLNTSFLVSLVFLRKCGTHDCRNHIIGIFVLTKCWKMLAFYTEKS